MLLDYKIQQHIYKKMLLILIGGPYLLAASVAATLTFGSFTAAMAPSATVA